MDKDKPTFVKGLQQHLFVFAVLLLVLLTSCSIKGGIKSLAGMQAGTELGLTKKTSHFIGNGIEQCINGETTDTNIFQTTSTSSADTLPAILLTAVFIFLSGFTVIRKQKHPLYGNHKISGSLPIFLQYRKLII